MELTRDDAGRLALTDGGLVLAGDFTRMRPRIAPHALGRELLVRAARLRGFEGVPRAVDATAGLGEDSLLLAASGFKVILVERDPLIAALVADALERARATEDLGTVVGRMTLIEGDSVEVLPALGCRVDLVYLDPMFPARTKDAATKKKLQMVRRLERPATDEEGIALVEAALAVHPRRIVVKRPIAGPTLGPHKPSHSISGKLVRYDCLLG